jgi:hypothetical protein
MGNAYKILRLGNLKGRNQLGDRKYCVRIWTGFIWLMMMQTQWWTLVYVVIETSGSIKDMGVLH